jgi:hypothetical protein
MLDGVANQVITEDVSDVLDYYFFTLKPEV